MPEKNKLLKWFLLFYLFFPAACSERQPDHFQTGDFQCEVCRMSIVDMRFKAEIITTKGRIIHFDSIECLLHWKHQHPKKVKSAWVTDFFHPEKWLRLEKARFLKGKTLPSPMGGFLSAHDTPDDLKQAQQNFGGEEIHPQ